MSEFGKKEYIGDSVYVEVDDWGRLVLTIENGYGPSNRIVLEMPIWDALKDYVARAEKRAKEHLREQGLLRDGETER